MTDVSAGSKIPITGGKHDLDKHLIGLLKSYEYRLTTTINFLLILYVYESMASISLLYAIGKQKVSLVILHWMIACTLLFLLQYHLSIKMLKLIRHLISKWKVIILSQNFIPITFFPYYMKWIKSSTKHWEIKQSIRSSLNITEIGTIKSISHGWVII